MTLERMPWGMRWNLATRILRGEFHQVMQSWSRDGETLTLESHESVARRTQL